MTRYLSLTKIFLKNLRVTSSKSKKQKVIMNLLLLFVLLFILIPFLFCCQAGVYSITTKLMEYDYQNIGLEMMCMLVMIFAFIFGFNVILNEFYFSEDIGELLPLPLKPFQIIAAKFTATFITESVLLLAVILFSVFGYFIALKIPITNIFAGLFGILTLPVIPLVYCGIISIILMSLTKFIKNKEQVRNFGAFFIFMILVVSIFLISKLHNFDLDKYIEKFVNGDQGFLEVMRVIFPHIDLFIDTLSTASILALLKYIVINVVYVCVFLIVAELLYFRGVLDLNTQSTDSLKKEHDKINKIKVKSVKKSYFLKEIYTLFRTPSYLLNCIAINFIWPLFVYLIYVFTSNMTIDKISSLIQSGDKGIYIFILFYLINISILVPSISSICASSFSREGKHFDFIKFIPVRYHDQIMVKTFVGVLLSFLGINVLTTIFYIVVKMPFYMIIVYHLISLFLVCSVCLLGVLIDSVYPKLTWDDELDSLRENTNSFVAMGLSIFILVIILVGTYILYRCGYMLGHIILITSLTSLVLMTFMYLLVIINVSKNIKSMEDL